MHSPPVVYVGATGPVTECENVLTQVRGLGVNTCVCVLYVVRGVGVAVTFVKHAPFPYVVAISAACSDPLSVIEQRARGHCVFQVWEYP